MEKTPCIWNGFELIRKSLELEPTRAKWLLARTTDRYLWSIDKPQIYGMHYKRLEDKTVVFY